VIQAGVLAVTALHVLGEWWSEQLVTGVHPALHHVPVILYLAPIAYASLRYGIEGYAGFVVGPPLIGLIGEAPSLRVGLGVVVACLIASVLLSASLRRGRPDT
jgi:hypothetical protein